MTTNRWAVAVALMAMGFGPVAGADDATVEHLVRAKVTAVGEKQKDGGIPATLEVVHSYSGHRKLIGKTFDAWSYDGSVYGGGRVPRRPFKVDEEDLWALTVRRDEKTAEERVTGVHVVSRRADNRRHEQEVTRAEAVEVLALTKPDERLGVLKKFATDPTPEVAWWAAREITWSKDKAAGEYLDTLAQKPDPKWALVAKMTLDGALTERKKDEWVNSEARSALLRECVSGRADEFEGMTTLAELDAAQRDKRLPDALAFELVTRVADNPDWAWPSRVDAIRYVGRFARGFKDEKLTMAAYEWVFERVRAGEMINVRRAAAKTLEYAFPLTPTRLKAVEEILEREKDENVSEYLRKAVKKAKEKK